MLGDLNCTMDKIDRDGENKTQRLYRCCSNCALWKLIVDHRLEVYGEWRTQSSPATIGPLPRIQDTQGLYWCLYWYKIANNIKINHIMVSFTNHYNAISIDRLPSKAKIGKDSWYFNNSLLCKPKVSSSTNTFFIKNTKNKYSCSGSPAFKSWSCRLRFS